MVPRRAGQFALEKFRRLALWACALLIPAGTVSFFVPRSWRLWVGLIALAMIAVAKRIVDRSESWLAGGLGERAVGDALSVLEAEGYVVLHDLDTGRGNVDHVVLGPTGAFVIETKAWKGSVYPAKGGRQLMCNKRDETRALRQASAEAMEIKKRLRGAAIDTWIGAVIVLTRATLPKPVIDFPGVDVVRVDDVCAHVRAGRRALTSEQIVRGRAAVLRGKEIVSVSAVSFEGPLPPAGGANRS
jgi:hypothetical protein